MPPTPGSIEGIRAKLDTSFREESVPIVRAINWIVSQFNPESRDNPHPYGQVVTPHGIVTVHSWFGYADHSSTRTILRFAHNGKLYTRRYKKAYGQRYLFTLARRFAAEIAGT